MRLPLLVRARALELLYKNPTVPSALIANDGFVAIGIVSRSKLHVLPPVGGAAHVEV